MATTYLLKIHGSDVSAIERIIGLPSSAPFDHPWTMAIHEEENAPPVPYVDQFLSLLNGKLEHLQSLTDSPVVCVWVLFEYNQECNLEFSALDMGKLSHHNISLCVSCWQKAAVSDQAVEE